MPCSTLHVLMKPYDKTTKIPFSLATSTLISMSNVTSRRNKALAREYLIEKIYPEEESPTT